MCSADGLFRSDTELVKKCLHAYFVLFVQEVSAW